MRQSPALESLRAQVEKIEGRDRRTASVLQFGLAAMDSRLPGGGLARGALHEIAGGGNDAVMGSAPGLFAAGIAARTTGKILWCLSKRDLFSPAVAQVGLKPDRVIFIEAGSEQTILACFEEGLRHGGLGAVVAKIGRLPMTASRRSSWRPSSPARWGSRFGAGAGSPMLPTSVSRSDTIQFRRFRQCIRRF